MDCASNWLASAAKSTFAVDRDKRTRPSSDEKGTRLCTARVVTASRATIGQGNAVVSNKIKTRRAINDWLGFGFVIVISMAACLRFIKLYARSRLRCCGFGIIKTSTLTLLLMPA